jgi:O-antigen/teichoic acid export membrane protein
MEAQVEARGMNEARSSAPGPGRARRLIAGWSANLIQMVLGMTQQVALVPVFLHFWSSEILAAWLVIYAAGNLVSIADFGLQFRTINRFLRFKSSADADVRTARIYTAMLGIYLWLAGGLVVVLLISTQLLLPSAVLGFKGVANFDSAFVVMTAGMLLTLPSNLVSGLYRTRGLYGRAVKAQNVGMLVGQVGQLVTVVVTQSLLAVTLAYVASQIAVAVYLLVLGAPRLFPFLRARGVRFGARWILGEFRGGVPFALANATELALLNLPVLLVGALVADRAAVTQWGLTRIVAGLLRALCIQVTLPLAAELGHDYAVGQKDQLRCLYARGSVLVTLLASIVVSGLLPFWQDFFAIWTQRAVPYDSTLVLILLIGTGAVAPSILALGYANYSNRGGLLVRTKGLQLAVLLALSVLLIPPLGPLGAAIAVVTSDLLIQFGLLGVIMIAQTLARPFCHVALLAVIMILVTSGGWALGVVIRSWIPGTGLARFTGECVLWLLVMVMVASPLASARIRERLIAEIPQ